MQAISYMQAGRDKDTTTNAQRIDNLCALIKEINQRKLSNLDAIILPGGYLHLDEFNISADTIQQQPALKNLKQAIAPLKDSSPNLQLITGLDTKPFEAHGRLVGGQQLSIAMGYNNVSGAARKICPVQEDFDGLTMPKMLVHESDFYDERRYVPLSGQDDQLALLCVCYDMFGMIDAARGETARMRNLVLLEDMQGNLHEGRDAFHYYKEIIQPRFQQIYDSKKDKIALPTANIHRFQRSPKESFWHRHGIASASAAFNSALSVGAAHFETLPPTPDKATLSSYNVPHEHLELAGHRKLNSHKSDEAFYISSGDKGNVQGLARLYSARP